MKVKLLLILSIFYFSVLFGYCATISVDINNIETPQGNWIVLANGSWNDWGWGVQLYDDDNDGVFQGTQCNLENNSYGYVHTITGEFDSWGGWGMVSNAPYNSSCDFIPNDPWLNYGFEINDNDIITQVNSWGECGLVDSYYPIASLVKPANGDILNYIYIPFEWGQFPDAIGYNIQASESDSFNSIILDHFTEQTLFIAKENFEWDTTYYWRVQPVLLNGEVGEWTDLSMFSIGPQEFNLTSEIFTQDSFLYEYTVFGDWNNYRTSIVDIDGTLKISGGSDKVGFPMRSDVHGSARNNILLTSGVGFRSKVKGMQKRKIVRGSMISDDIYQINTILVKGNLVFDKPAEKAKAEEKPAEKAKAEEDIKTKEESTEK